MKPTTVLASVTLLIIISGIWFFLNRVTSVAPAVSDYKNISYSIEGQPITLIDGKAETSAVPGSSSKYVTQYFGNEAKGDLNGDGVSDLTFILTQFTGGSGMFYYVVAALQNTDGSYMGSNGVMLGDRIAPQSTEIKNGEIVVNYVERRANEPMTASPTVGASKRLKVNGTNLSELARMVSGGERCGGNMANAPVCAAGLHCAAAKGSKLPFADVGGTCVSD